MMRFINIHTHNFTGKHTELNAYGVHPWDAEKVDISTLGENDMLFAGDAIGEIGLDFACGVDKSLQEELLCRQLEIAQHSGKTVVMHCVKAFEHTMNLLLRYSLKAVIFHGFIGSKEQAEQALSRGYYLSFGHRTKHSPKTIEALRATPLDRLFAETDESDLPIEKMYDEIASLRGIEVERLAEQIENNYNTIFSTISR